MAMISSPESGNVPRDSSSVMNRVALAFLIASVATFTAFHFLPLAKQDDGAQGWSFWVGIADVVRMPSVLRDPEAGVALASLATFVVLVLCSPFLTGFYRRSRVLRWLATVMSGLATAGFWITFGRGTFPEDMSAGVICLFVTPVLTLVGLLLIRGEKRELPPAG